jgi:hypothetical protein
MASRIALFLAFAAALLAQQQGNTPSGGGPITINGVVCNPNGSCNANWTSGAITSGHLAVFTGTSGQILDGGVGAASNVNLTQLQLQEAQKQAQAAGEAFTAAKAAYEAHLHAMCPGTEPDPSFDEPKCKPKPEPTSVGTSGAASDLQN